MQPAWNQGGWGVQTTPAYPPGYGTPLAAAAAVGVAAATAPGMTNLPYAMPGYQWPGYSSNAPASAPSPAAVPAAMGSWPQAAQAPQQQQQAEQWQQWQQWQQQYAQWQQQYGKDYMAAMQASGQMPTAPPNAGSAAPSSQPMPPALPPVSAAPPLPPTSPPPSQSGAPSKRPTDSKDAALDSKKTRSEIDEAIQAIQNSLTEMADAEKQFDEQFNNWESQFNSWREENANHPDTDQYQAYEAKWTSWRNQLLSRREQMKKKKDAKLSELEKLQAEKAAKKASIAQASAASAPNLTSTMPLQNPMMAYGNLPSDSNYNQQMRQQLQLQQQLQQQQNQQQQLHQQQNLQHQNQQQQQQQYNIYGMSQNSMFSPVPAPVGAPVDGSSAASPSGTPAMKAPPAMTRGGVLNQLGSTAPVIQTATPPVNAYSTTANGNITSTSSKDPATPLGALLGSGTPSSGGIPGLDLIDPNTKSSANVSSYSTQSLLPLTQPSQELIKTPADSKPFDFPQPNKAPSGPMGPNFMFPPGMGNQMNLPPPNFNPANQPFDIGLKPPYGGKNPNAEVVNSLMNSLNEMNQFSPQQGPNQNKNSDLPDFSNMPPSFNSSNPPPNFNDGPFNQQPQGGRNFNQRWGPPNEDQPPGNQKFGQRWGPPNEDQSAGNQKFGANRWGPNNEEEPQSGQNFGSRWGPPNEDEPPRGQNFSKRWGPPNEGDSPRNNFGGPRFPPNQSGNFGPGSRPRPPWQSAGGKALLPTPPSNFNNQAPTDKTEEVDMDLEADDWESENMQGPPGHRGGPPGQRGPPGFGQGPPGGPRGPMQGPPGGPHGPMHGPPGGPRGPMQGPPGRPFGPMQGPPGRPFGPMQGPPGRPFGPMQRPPGPNQGFPPYFDGPPGFPKNDDGMGPPDNVLNESSDGPPINADDGLHRPPSKGLPDQVGPSTDSKPATDESGGTPVESAPAGPPPPRVHEAEVIIDYRHRPADLGFPEFFEPESMVDYAHGANDMNELMKSGALDVATHKNDKAGRPGGPLMGGPMGPMGGPMGPMAGLMGPMGGPMGPMGGPMGPMGGPIGSLGGPPPGRGAWPGPPPQHWDSMDDPGSRMPPRGRDRDDRPWDDRRDEREDRRDDRRDDRDDRRDSRRDERREEDRRRDRSRDRERDRDRRSPLRWRNRDDDRKSRDRDRDDRKESRGRDRDRERDRGQQPNDKSIPVINLTLDDPTEVDVPKVFQVSDLLLPPGRHSRPNKIIVIIRGPPGSGKSFAAKLLKDKEIEMGGCTPRILSIDDYFMVETDKEEVDPETGRKVIKKVMEYEYEAGVESNYQESLVKAFRKTVNDGFFPFIIVDSVNSRVSNFEDISGFGRQKGFQVYICEMEMDATECAKRNIHGRTASDIEDIIKKWEKTPSHEVILDIRSLLQEAAITEVDMEDTSEEAKPEESTAASEETKEDPTQLPPTAEQGPPPATKENKEEEQPKPAEDNKPDAEKDKENPSQKKEDDDEQDETEPRPGFFSAAIRSKWDDLDSSFNKLDRLDGLAKARTSASIEDWLQLPEDYFQSRLPTFSEGVGSSKKRVRWADLEERYEQEKMRAIGFVVGQTDWSRMMDPTSGQSKLTQTKYI